MRALRAEDPEELGGHRLLARLGAGGMGVVYLARSPDGTPAALKVIRAEYAADPAFRARFRREVRLATGLTGRWVVAVSAADTEAREPWLATAFVPGPSLAEAVDGIGPLPSESVAVLGSRLAQALSELHAVDLVHRDVKPGNILLVPDGPRLIDFGIAKGAGATALTAPDAVVGTPGYLSPNRPGRTAARSARPATCSPSAAYWRTRQPGGGRSAPVTRPWSCTARCTSLPDRTGLAQLPSPLRSVIDGCLAKNPALRPTAAEVRSTLTHDRSSGRRPRPGDRLAATCRTTALIAERSARALDPPPRTAGPIALEQLNTHTAQGFSRRRVLTIAGSAAAALAASGTAAAVLLLTRGHPPATGARRDIPTHPRPARRSDGLSENPGQGTGARRAPRRHAAHNARANISYRLALSSYDDGGDAARSVETARRVLATRSVSAVIGPSTTAGARAAAAAAPPPRPCRWSWCRSTTEPPDSPPRPCAPCA
ncbi:bifunctional serine/threonine-protein kinase/ABC transporter substrate-binding protein [Streptomyces sp. L7]